MKTWYLDESTTSTMLKGKELLEVEDLVVVVVEVVEAPPSDWAVVVAIAVEDIGQLMLLLYVCMYIYIDSK
jgi:hypothetical protein